MPAKPAQIEYSGMKPGNASEKRPDRRRDLSYIAKY